MRTDDLGKLILRLAIGGLLLFHGVSKIMHGIDWMPAMLAAKNLPDVLRYGVYIGEVVAPILVILGLFGRVAGFIICINMAMATYIVKMGQVGELTKSGGWALELEALYFLGALAIVFLGSGRFSLRRGAARVD